MTTDETTPRRLSDEFSDLALFCEKNDSITLYDLIQELRIFSHGVLTFFLSLPFLLPIPLPGLSVIVGLFIAVEGLSIVLGRELYLPKKMMRIKLKREFFKNFFERSAKWIDVCERIVKPRMHELFSLKFIRISIGLMITICGLFLAAPLPPGTNFPPALAIIVLSLGLLEKDVACYIFGIVLFVLNVIGFTYLFLFGEKLFKYGEYFLVHHS